MGGKSSGEGTFYYDNGNVKYIGSILNGKYNGYGTFCDKKGHIEYAGEWENGETMED